MTSTNEIAQILSATLNPDANTRVTAELKLAESFADINTGLALAHIVLTQDADTSLRQSASIALRKYVKERWSPYFSGFRGSAPPPEIKTQIRQAVFRGLSDPNRRVRSLCAHTLSSIANCDWPDEYPDLLTALINLLSSDSTDSIHGAMQVFTEFIKADLTEDQILPVLRQLLPVLLNILGATESHSPLTRARTISVFRQCVTALFMVKDQHPQSVQEATGTVLPIWLEAFKVLLNIDPVSDISNGQNWDGLAVRIQIFKALSTINTSFSKALTQPFLVEFLTASVRHLHALYPTFAHYYIADEESVPNSSEDEVIDLAQLICPILDLVSAVIRHGKCKEWLGANLQELISGIFDYAQITHEDEETWANNPNAFVAQEDDETQAYSIRVAGFEVLNVFMDRLPAQTTRAFSSIVQRIILSSQQARDTGSEDWWRPLEAALAVIGSQAEPIVDCVQDEQDSGREKPIDIESLLANVVPPILGLPQHPFLQGRGFVFASQFSSFLPLQSSGQYLEAAFHVIELDRASIPVKISAIKAVHNFFQNGDDDALVPYASRIAKDLGPFLPAASEDTLGLVLETLSVVVEVGKGSWVTSDLAASLIQAILQVWHKNNKDPIFISILTDILTTLAGSSSAGIYEVVVKSSLPPFSNAIAAVKKEESWIASSAIDLVASLIRGAPESGLGEGFFSVLAPALFACLGDAEDRDVIQNGIECLTLIIRKDCNQLVSWTDSEGRNGLDYVLKLVARLLESQDEAGGLVIGDLIIHLFRRAGEAILPVLPQLLQAMVSRMRTAKTATFLQSLVSPFAFLINNQRDTILDLLESTNIGGRSGLDILIQTWCENAETFQGLWASRISTLALSQLLTSERPSLQNLTVKGELIVKAETRDVIMTRSKTKKTVAAPHEFTSIPFPGKALKLIIHDLQSNGDSATITAQGHTFDVDSDDGDEEWTEEERQHQGFKEEEFAFLSEMLGPKGVAFDNDEIFDNNDDDDLKNDPVSQMDMQAHLVGFLRECASRNTANFNQIADQLSAEELLVLRKALEGR
ncbi:ARM repeat-containing protein [Macrolepiota fuliginosa MF-IS2]|uniref:ARM repeat-containing protein n=1 Tax=Macrolepiota fuliginosa MF-IS2 TaxID=1400762 RepID=A0A9P6C153_9AGAR|nr:ARM repeat-containing protein [Macrolepiota fuliginosa MF-IS2]